MTTTATTTRPRRLGTGPAFSVVLGAVLVVMAGASAPSPFYPVLQERIGFSSATLTVVFAVYALVLLATLLVAGSLSDHVGRRPVLFVGLLVLAASMVALWQADAVATLVVARAVQGAAAGLLLSTVSAAVVDLEPPERPGVAAVLNSVLPLAGLAVGALGAGIALDALDAAAGVVFGTLAVAYVLLAVGTWALPETSPRTEGWRRSLVPRVGVPRTARPAFVRAAPALVAGWATGGLYLSLTAPLVAGELGGTSHAVQGLAVAVLMATGSAGCFLARGWTPRRTALVGSASLAVGTALTLVAVSLGSMAGFLLTEVVAGFGFGVAFLGVMRSLTPTVGPNERGELFASVFVASYLAFGLPAVAAGAAVPHLGLLQTTQVYGGVVVLLAAVATVLRLRTAD